MLQQKTPDDYVMATGITTTVRDFISMAFMETGISLRWEGGGIDEKGIEMKLYLCRLLQSFFFSQ
jgi:GDPmannose 4,6-dehydratase